MLYSYRCPIHGVYEVRQSIWSDHAYQCPECGCECQRLYSTLEWVWAGTVYKDNGKPMEHDDWTPIMANSNG